jgi:Flp pilus assembly protein TadB
MLDTRTLRRRLILATAVSVVALGTGAWLVLGPLCAVAGVVVGCFLPTVILG